MTKRTPQETALIAEMEQTLLKPVAHDKQTDRLFHYTDAAGFKGIIETGEIWATHFDQSNDRGELRHGETTAVEEAADVLRELPEKSLRRYFVEQFLELYPRACLTRITSVYLASFSEAEDQLSQWRAYGSDGLGFALGLRSIPLPD